MVTRRAWLASATARLGEAGCEDAAFDARCLLEDLGGLPRGTAADDTPLTAEQETALNTARRWIWLREMGLMYSDMTAIAETLNREEWMWLESHGFEICSRAEIAHRLGIGEKRIDTGIGDPTGRHQCGGVPEL